MRIENRRGPVACFNTSFVPVRSQSGECMPIPRSKFVGARVRYTCSARENGKVGVKEERWLQWDSPRAEGSMMDLEGWHTDAVDLIDDMLNQTKLAMQPLRAEQCIASLATVRRKTGDENLNNINAFFRWLDTVTDDDGELKYERSPQQVQFHDTLIQACARIIYKREFDRDMAAIMERNRWTDVRQERFIGTPRRFGKTWAMAMLAANMLLSIPGFKCCIFATGKETTGNVLKLVKRFFTECPFNQKFKVVLSNSTRLEIESLTDLTDRREVQAFTSNASMSGPSSLSLLFVCVCLCLPPSSQTKCVLSSIRARESTETDRHDRDAFVADATHAIGTATEHGEPGE